MSSETKKNGVTEGGTYHYETRMNYCSPACHRLYVCRRRLTIATLQVFLDLVQTLARGKKVPPPTTFMCTGDALNNGGHQRQYKSMIMSPCHKLLRASGERLTHSGHF